MISKECQRKNDIHQMERKMKKGLKVAEVMNQPYHIRRKVLWRDETHMDLEKYMQDLARDAKDQDFKLRSDAAKVFIKYEEFKAKKNEGVSETQDKFIEMRQSLKDKKKPSKKKKRPIIKL